MLDRLLTWYKETELNHGIFWFIIGYHALAFIGVPLYLIYGEPSAALWLSSLFLLAASLMSITMGYHRLYSHRTYEASPVVEWPLIFFGTLSLQGSIIRWSFDHRLHHKHVDQDGDPYGTSKGFWHSHIIWMFKKGAPVREGIVRDLFNSRILRHQHEHYLTWALGVNVLVTVLVGVLVGDIIGAFCIAFLLRLFLGHHSTWFINSLAHYWGSRPYSTEHSAVNNFVIALLTYGEGYHNYHHTFAGDYRNGIKWWHFDPSKHMIWLLSRVGLTWNLRRVNDMTIKKRLVTSDRNLMLDHVRSAADATLEALAEKQEQIRRLRQQGVERMEVLKQAGYDRFEQLEAHIDSASRDFVSRTNELKAAMDAYRKARQERVSRPRLKVLKRRMHTLRQQVRSDWREWQHLCKTVLQVQPLPA